MKIRFWHKAYLRTLALFLICLNAGILSLAVYTHQKNVETAETTAASQYQYIADLFETDYGALMKNGGVSPSLLAQSYGAHYRDKGVLLAFVSDGTAVYSDFPQLPTEKSGTLTHTEFDGKRHALIVSDICGGTYTFAFAKNVSSLDEEFRTLMMTYALTGLGVSLLLAVCLFAVLKRLSVPLEKLRATTEKISQGDLTVKADQSGNDEFALLAESFNSMLGTINGQMAELETDAAQKQMLVDNMAHELRTPLTCILGYAEFLEKANPSEQDRILASKYILSEAKRLVRVSEVLLDAAYIRENAPPMEEIDLGTVLADTASRLRAKADARGVRLVCTAETVRVTGNVTLLSMLFDNLTENAVKACGQGGEVRLSCGGSTASVADNGKGMTEEQLVHITEPFYRTDTSRSRAEGGAGLGLALCRRIADAHGAVLAFASAPQKGTTVSVTFQKCENKADFTTLR